MTNALKIEQGFILGPASPRKFNQSLLSVQDGRPPLTFAEKSDPNYCNAPDMGKKERSLYLLTHLIVVTIIKKNNNKIAAGCYDMRPLSLAISLVLPFFLLVPLASLK